MHITYKRQSILVYNWVLWLYKFGLIYLVNIVTNIGCYNCILDKAYWCKDIHMCLYGFLWRRLYITLLIISILHLHLIGLTYAIVIIDHVSYALSMYH